MVQDNTAASDLPNSEKIASTQSRQKKSALVVEKKEIQDIPTREAVSSVRNILSILRPDGKSVFQLDRD